MVLFCTVFRYHLPLFQLLLSQIYSLLVLQRLSTPSINVDIFFPLHLSPSTVPSVTVISIPVPTYSVSCPLDNRIQTFSVFLCSVQNRLITHSASPFYSLHSSPYPHSVLPFPQNPHFTSVQHYIPHIALH